ncbi:MAG: hypothetical protein ACI4M5_02525 [Christensenellales bacterium]
MATIYFDVKDDFLLADGKTLQDDILTTSPNSTVALSYMSAKSDSLAQLVKLIVKDDVVQPHDRLKIIDCKGGVFCVRFKPTNIALSADKQVLCEEFITCDDTEHCLTCYNLGGYHLSVETENELIVLDCPHALIDLQCRAIPLSQSCQLLSVTATCHNKKFLAVLEYEEDYTILLQCYGDEVQVLEDCVRITDDLHDMCGRRMHRYLTLHDGGYVVDKVEFDYERTLSCCDALLCYALVESCYVGDWDMVNTIAPSIPIASIANTLGDFSEILSVPVVPYRPNRLGLVYGGGDYSYVKYFDFVVQDGTIQRIKCV